VNIYLCGYKGLAALRACLKADMQINNVFISPDKGVSNDPFEEINRLAQRANLCINSEINNFSKSGAALAVGWKRLIRLDYENLFVIHDSLLPKYRGWNPLVTALQNKDTEIGVTLIKADTEVDHGPILSQKLISINYPTRIVEAMDLVSTMIEELIKDLKLYLDHQVGQLIQQDHSLASFSLWRGEDDYAIDWAWSADEIKNFVDSVSFPYFGASSFAGSVKVRIMNAEVTSDLQIVNRTPGKILRIDSGTPIVVCGKGLLEITDWHRSGTPGTSYNLLSLRTLLTPREVN